MVEFIALGGALDPRGVLPGIGGSAHLLRCGDVGVLFDFGLYPDRVEREERKIITAPELSPKRIIRRADLPIEGSSEYLALAGRDHLPTYDVLKSLKRLYVVGTHPHVDHIAAFPWLGRKFPEAQFFMTRGTHQISEWIWNDGIRIARSRGQKPLFEEEDVQWLYPRIRYVSEGQIVEPESWLSIQFFGAGHIRGAVSALVTIQTGGSPVRIFVTGDMSRSSQQTVAPAEMPKGQSVDYLITESTYGGRSAPPRFEVCDYLATEVEQCLRGGGKFLFGALTIGRSQEILAILEAYGITERWPVYIDGAARHVTKLYAMGVEKEERRLERYFMRSHAMRERVLRDSQPAVLIAPHGMYSHGYSRGYLKRLAPDPSNRISLTAHQDPCSTGHHLSKMRPGDSMMIDGEEIRVNARILRFHLSAHMDGQEILQTIEEVVPNGRVLTVHGDKEAMEDIVSESPRPTTAVQLGEVYTL